MEKLTTSQMIERLGLEDIAINQDGYKVGYDHKGNLLLWGKNEDKPQVTDGNQFVIYFLWIKKDRWEINHDFVDYDEAMSANADEKKTVIYYHNKNKQYRFVSGEYGHFIKLAEDGIGLNELAKGKWIIEN